jgi:hypothetical protein
MADPNDTLVPTLDHPLPDAPAFVSVHKTPESVRRRQHTMARPGGVCIKPRGTATGRPLANVHITVGDMI